MKSEANRSYEQQDAAAASDLLAALKDVLRIAKAASIGITGNAPRIARAEAAIAKAEAALKLGFMDLRAGDRVTIRTAQGQHRTGRAQMLLTQPQCGTVVLNMGGPHGTPEVCTPSNFVSAVRRAA